MPKFSLKLFFFTSDNHHDPRLFHPRHDELTVPLERYMGDVLIVYYLMSHSSAGIVEGSPTPTQWMIRLQSSPSSQPREMGWNGWLWYQRWVYYHSTMLRMCSFTRQQQDQLGLCSSGILRTTGTSNPAMANRQTMPYCYVEPPMVLADPELLVSTAILELSTLEGKASLIATFNHFGPLGPSFRGRDEVRTRRMEPELLVFKIHDKLQGSYLPDDTWLSGQDEVVAWMMEMQLESRRQRPMTVLPPLITIQPSE